MTDDDPQRVDLRIKLGPLALEQLVPGGILPTDTCYDTVHEDACSRCGREIREDEVPLHLWAGDGRYMWIFCNDCDATEHLPPEPDPYFDGDPEA